MTLPETSQLHVALAERYTIIRELGAGGMATVFLAEDLRHRRKVAVKVLHPELSAVIGSDRFLKEIELTANLQHPHILPLFDSGDVNGQLYYVMPFIEGETLRGRLDREQQLPVGDAVRIAREVADALAYAHKRGIVHRDIKPENILLQDGHALVADFGIALAVQQAGAGRLTQTGLSLGTPQYMSPEQAMGERAIDQRADIYALGAVTYEMLSGEAPFTGPTAQAIIARAMTERPRSLMAARETLPPAVDSAVMTALAKLPADRFATATEFAEALAREGTQVGSTAVHASAYAGRGTARWVPWAALAAGLMLGAAITVAGRRQRAVVVSDGEPRFWSITLPDSAPFVAAHDSLDVYVRSLDISPDGRFIVWTSQHDSTSNLWQMRTDVGIATPVPGTVGGMLPTFSPDGKDLAFAVGNEIRKLDLSTGTGSRVGKYSFAEAMYWPFIDRLIVTDYYACLNATTPNGGAFTKYPTASCEYVTGGVSRVADEQRLIVSSGGVIGVLDVLTGKTRRVVRAGAADTSGVASLVIGENPLVVDKHALTFLRDSTLYAAHIDLDGSRLVDEPRQILSGIRRESMTGAGGGGQLALSRNGVLVWLSGSDAGVSRFVLVSPPDSRTDSLALPAANVNSYALSTDGQRLAYTVTLPDNMSVLRILDRARNVVDSARFPVEIQVGNWVDADSALAVRLPSARVPNRQFAIVRGLGSSMRIDSTGVEYVSSSRDGRMRCGSGKFWPATSPGDSVRFSAKGNWCRFSPDGRHISWDDRGGLMVAPTDRGAAAARRRVGPAGANEARWSDDGRELIYRTGNKWFAVPAEPRANGELSQPRVVLQGTYNQAWASWALAPDGRLLLLKSAPQSRATHLNVLTNFPRYVEERLKSTASPESR